MRRRAFLKCLAATAFAPALPRAAEACGESRQTVITHAAGPDPDAFTLEDLQWAVDMMRGMEPVKHYVVFVHPDHLHKFEVREGPAAFGDAPAYVSDMCEGIQIIPERPLPEFRRPEQVADPFLDSILRRPFGRWPHGS